MPEFCKEIGYNCERDAEAAFSKLLSDNVDDTEDTGDMYNGNLSEDIGQASVTNATDDAKLTMDKIGTVPDPAPMISGEGDESLLIDDAEREVPLSQLESIGHECEPQGDEGCLTCLFKSYQRLCATALHEKELRITDVTDLVALLGVLVPFKTTARMQSIFPEKTLDELRGSNQEWPDDGFDETLVTSAVRVCM
ncbi:hypothetical protein BGZ70_007729 [Mortierella alpina]|uniref:Uncharacterized protein n=1 Tax=Mortierella alpina TaxID=64518 RepID=A0A9P6J562_MORAP|nr:hypothetical protein BGZ70_007729 [Mortierella alpina]